MNLRRLLTALAVLALCAGLASAQVVTPTPINCSVTAAVPTLRSQGVTERPGDVLITCTGGPAPNVGSTLLEVDRATIQVSFAGVPITNSTHGDGVSIGGNAQNSTDALLLIDEPNDLGGPAPGYGQNAGITVCTALQQAADVVLGSTAATNCPTYGQNVDGYWVLDLTGAGGGHAANAYQGSTPNSNGGNTVLTFQDVPVLSTGSTAVSRVYRLVNTRLNVGTNSSITANVTITPATNAVTTLNLTNNNVSVGQVLSGLTTSVSTVGGATLCSTTSLQPGGGVAKANLALLTFTAGFSTAFKTRALPISTGAVQTEQVTAANAGPYYQNVANGTYTASYIPTTGGSAQSVTLTSQQSESGVLVTGTTLPDGITAGLAGSGTRFKAVFSGLSTNAKYYVSAVNVTDFSDEAAPPNIIGDATPTPYALLVGTSSGGSITPETVALAPAAYVVNPASVWANGNGPGVTVPPGVRVIQITPNGTGSAEAVWEVVNTTPNAPAFNFAFYATYSNVTNPPPVGTDGSVALGFAPTSGSGNATTTNSWVPRFNAIGAAVPAFVVVPCQTTLLFPYLTNFSNNTTPPTHWETGVSIANTGADPWNSVLPTAAGGTCNLNFYGTNPPPIITTPAITPGKQYAFVVSDPANTGTAQYPGFQGYLFAVCNFQFAHGFAFVEDGSPAGNAMGYLALVVDNRSAIQRAAALTGEDLSH